MPFDVKKNHPQCPKSKPFAVVKTSDGKKMGCHATSKSAFAQIKAIEESEKKQMTEAVDVRQTNMFDLESYEGRPDEKELQVVDQFGTVEDSDEWVDFGVTSFKEHDAAVEAKKAATEFRKTANVFQRIISNILADNRVADPIEKIRSAAGEFGERAKGISLAKEKSFDAKSMTPFNVYYSKERDLYLFLTAYSNNYLDHDNPPEIISSKSHERFEALVDAGEVPLPKSCLWHIPSLVLGEVEVLTYDKETGVAMAAGFFYKEAEPIAKIIAANPEQWGVSHSMDGETIKKEENVIVEHITFEIGPLPSFAAANRWADYQIVTKETSMSIPKKKRKALNEMGVGDDLLDELENSNKSLAKTIGDLEVPTKETIPTEDILTEDVPAEDAPAEDAPAEEAPEEVPAEEEAPVEETEEVPAEEPAPEAEPEEAPEVEVEETEPAFTEDQTKELVAAFEAVVTKVTEGVMAQVKEEIAPLKEDALTRIEKTLEQQTPVTLQELILSSPAMKSHSATRSVDTIVDGRSSLAKDKPEETPATPSRIVYSGNTLVDGAVSDVVLGKSPIQQ